MTVIIDDINVSPCKFFCEKFVEDFPDDGGVQETEFCVLCYSKCEKHSNCDFKKLQRANKKIQELSEYIQANQPTGICETCTDIAVSSSDAYCKALKSIIDIINEGIHAGMNYEINDVLEELNKELENIYGEHRRRF